MKPTLRFLASIPLVLLTAWWALALFYAGPGPEALRATLGGGYALTVLATLFFVRPFRKAVGIFTVVFALSLGWWSTVRPTNDKDWAPEVSQLASGEVKGDTLVVHNVRNFNYRTETDFDVVYEDRTYDLSKLKGVDLVLSYWAGPSIAHTIMSWEFADGQHLAISIETRKDRTQEYSAVAGFFRQYEIVYVVADERDLVGLRTNYRGEEVYLYRLRASLQRSRALLMDYLASINDLVDHPQFYNAFTDNCTTSIRRHVKHINPSVQFDWRILVNGYADQMLYDVQSVDTSMPFAQLRQASFINERAKAGGTGPGFSERIRVGLPLPPERR